MSRNLQDLVRSLNLLVSDAASWFEQSLNFRKAESCCTCCVCFQRPSPRGHGRRAGEAEFEEGSALTSGEAAPGSPCGGTCFSLAGDYSKSYWR